MLPESVIQTNAVCKNHICKIIELYDHRVRSTGSTFITLVHIGYATRSKYIIKGALLLYYGGKMAKRGRIDRVLQTKQRLTNESIGSLGSTM